MNNKYLIHPHGEGVPVSDQEPLPDVELCLIDKQRSLNVLLHYVSAYSLCDTGIARGPLQYVVQF